jgi:hypothetical protein
MRPNDHLRPTQGPFSLDLTLEEVLEDLCWPGPPPGRWEGVPVRLRGPADVDVVLERRAALDEIERAA